MEMDRCPPVAYSLPKPQTPDSSSSSSELPKMTSIFATESAPGSPRALRSILDPISMNRAISLADSLRCFPGSLLSSDLRNLSISADAMLEIKPPDTTGVVDFIPLCSTPDGKAHAYSEYRLLTDLFAVSGLH
jgi:hypothetical protein